MKPLVRLGVIVTAASVAVSFLTVCVPGVGAAQPAPASSPSSAASSFWAYGGLVSKSWAGRGATYQGDASVTAGFAVILNETEGSGGVHVLQVNRTMGLILSVDYCSPSCARPTTLATVYFHAWESVRATLTLTTAATVNVTGSGPTAALGLTSSNVTVSAGLREATKVVSDGVVLQARNVSVNFSANSSTTFVPALGLVPLELTSGTAWTSHSAFAQDGYAMWSVFAQLAGGLISVNKGGTVTLNNSSGTVALAGSVGPTAARLGGSSYDVVALTLAGPFAVREGFLLLPSGSDVFGSTPPSWLSSNVSTSGSASASQGTVDVTSSPGVGVHLGFAASSLVWTSGATEPTSTAAPGGLAPAFVPATSGSNTTTVQGSPESVAQATTDQNCLASGVGCPGSGGGRGPLGPLLVLAVVTVAIVLAVVLIAERRRSPPPAYPNAGLYPPGARGGGGPGSPRPATPPSPPPEDPLGHLW
jgi:hypothetical protein